MLILLALATPEAAAKDVLHVAIAHEWSERMSRNGAQMGPSLKADVGYGKGIGIGKIIPEVGIGVAYDQGVFVPRAGVRAILGWVITPGAYAHVNAAIGGPFSSPALGFDTGITLDLSLPYVRIGGFAGLQVFGGESGPSIPDQNLVAGVELIFSLPTLRN